MELFPLAQGASFLRFLLQFLVVVSLFPSTVFAGNVVNRTIDDSFGDSQTGQLVIYQPPTSNVWQDETCLGCAIRPDVDQAFKHTYTAATYNPGLGNINITMQFNGTAIYVFFILANNAGDGITTLTEANFTLDGNPPQLFQHAPDLTTTNILFNQLVFKQENLLNAQHTLVISTSGVNTNVYVNFDYAIYTHDDTDPLVPLPPPGSSVPPTSSGGPTPTTSSSSNPTNTQSSNTSKASKGGSTSKTSPTGNPNPAQSGSDLGSNTTTKKSSPIGAIVGGIIGGLAVLIAAAAILFFCLRRRKPRSRESMEAAGYVPPLMTEMEIPMNQPGPSTTVNPFTTPPSSQSTVNHYQQYSISSKGAQAGYGPGPLTYAPTGQGPSSQTDTESAYGGIAPTSQGSASGSTSGLVYASNNGSSRGRLISVTAGDHLSSPVSDLPLSSPSSSNSPPVPPASTKIEAIRRARQQELDQRLRTVQQEMAFLTSDITGEKGQGATRARSVRRPPVPNTGTQGDSEAGEELTMEEMREQLRQMRDQISYLRDQQQSAWAQGLSDDPPPGYEPRPDGGPDGVLQAPPHTS